MFELVLIGSLWAMVGATAIRLAVPIGVARRSPNGFLAALFGATALTLNMEMVYNFLDPLLGAQNYVDLTKHTSLVLCALFLAQAALGASDRARARDLRVLRIGLIVTIAIQTLAFFAVDAQPSTTDFMESFGDQPAAAVYSLSHFLFFGLAEAITLWVALHLFCSTRDGVGRVGAVALAIGAAAAVGNVGVIGVREVARLTGQADFASTLDAPYKVLLILIALGNCIGLGLPALQGAARRRRYTRSISALVDVLEPVHQRVMADDRFLVDLGDASDQLSRLEVAVVGIRDAQSTQRDVNLSDREQGALTTAEALLIAN